MILRKSSALAIVFLVCFSCKSKVEQNTSLSKEEDIIQMNQPIRQPSIPGDSPSGFSSSTANDSNSNGPISGRWEGRYYDAYGFNGDIIIDLQREQNELFGSVHLTVHDEESSSSYRGTFKGRWEDTEVLFTLYSPNSTPARPVDSAKFQGFLKFNNGAFALQTMYGAINIPAGLKTELGGGVWIVWFRERVR